MFYQVAGQIILLLFAKTATSTTGGLEEVFNQEDEKMNKFGIKNPIVVLAISIAITLKSCITLHLKTIKTEKQFVPFTSTFFILLWGFFSSLRRIISMVCFFIPSLGLFSCLYHFKAEQKPFSLWQKYGKTQMDKISLYGLNETVLWGELDRWDYSTSDEGTPPHYSEYTGLTLKWTFGLFYIITVAQFVTILLLLL